MKNRDNHNIKLENDDIRAIISDLDGTLTSNPKIINHKVLENISNLLSSGIIFILNSGRSLISILSLLKNSNFNVPKRNFYIICENGTYFYNPANPDIIYLANPFIQKVLIWKDHNYLINLLKNPENSDLSVFNSLIKNIKLQYKVFGFTFEIPQNISPNNILLIHKELKEIINKNNLNINIQLGNSVFDVFPKGSDKNNIFNILKKHFQISPNETIVLGDSCFGSDGLMMYTCKHSFCVGQNCIKKSSIPHTINLYNQSGEKAILFLFNKILNLGR